MRKRRADFVANLIVYDEPHLVYLKSGKQNVLAVAVTSLPGDEFDFFATTISSFNWDRYLQGSVDVRYLLSYATQKSNYAFKCASMHDGSVMMTPFDRDVPEEYLPEAGLFSDAHTEDFELGRVSGEIEEQLFIDGEWGVNEFGLFYQKYADLYAFGVAVEALKDPGTPERKKTAIRKSLNSKPFQGGGSYLQMFDELESSSSRDERLSLEGIVYNSPGKVRISGAQQHLSAIELIVRNYLVNRKEINAIHKEIRGHLVKRKLLAAHASTYDFVDRVFLLDEATKLYALLGLDGADEVLSACNRHPLVFAKIVLSLFRRIATSAGFFAEGRMSFEDPHL